MKKPTSRRPSKKPAVNYRMAPKRLVDLTCSPRKLFTDRCFDVMNRRFVDLNPPSDDFEIEAGDREDESAPSKPVKRGRQSALTAVIGAAFEAVVSKQISRKLEHGQALAAIVVVPSPAWVGPMTNYFRVTFGGRWLLQARDGKSRTQNSEIGSDEVSRDLARGLCVAGISADAMLLPRALVASVDITVHVAPPTSAVLRTAIARFAKRPPKDLPPGLGLGLDLHEIVACFRPGSGPQKIARRLESATLALRGGEHGVRVPDLAEALEYGEARTWGMQLARDLGDYRKGLISWNDLPKGVVLVSEPGLGKSLYAHSLSRHCGLPIVVSSVADWFTQGRSYLDEVIRSMRAVFDKAAALAGSPNREYNHKVKSGCILFLDEIDAIPNRATLDGRNRDFWLPILTDLLLRLDNACDPRAGVILVSATNNPQGIDPALLRPGRLEKMIKIERPGPEGVLNILKFHVAGAVPERELAELAAVADRSTGAEIMAWVREARRIARQAGRPLKADDLRAAAMNVKELPPETDWRICVHEAGHAASALAIGHGQVMHCVVGSRVGTENRTLINADQGDLATRSTIEDRATVLLAGRSAERVLLKDGQSIGAGGDSESDIGLATEAIASLHLSWGLGSTVSYLGTRSQVVEAVRYDSSLRALVEADLQRLQARADKIVEIHRDAVVAIAKALQKSRQLRGDAVRAIFEQHLPVRAGKVKGAKSCLS
ncbi:AAA family ATPase [Bradyrhizobium sp. CB1650]|uniref:AAA family ATPase n=1 Tax=Bradyrhizobium sp. CB1650 TaxID=3039153 RepID=UPI002435F89D|nr:AAA family ATPase [Bradyrhizobium sp. CB1650]WGD52439.1 AAA family ATPase [Bradyrhizobium sp. CB1650]